MQQPGQSSSSPSSASSPPPSHVIAFHGACKPGPLPARVLKHPPLDALEISALAALLIGVLTFTLLALL
ncbi:MAG: hypothetical protein HS128_19295 [Ideonella sp.]|nr:hypothetical protein [Ideonella sp.]MCC7455963.1 hypothetical protein [Nitrospira sp.]